jgi:hypothetical protein
MARRVNFPNLLLAVTLASASHPAWTDYAVLPMQVEHEGEEFGNSKVQRSVDALSCVMLLGGGARKHSVKYLSPQEAEAYVITLKDGRFVDSQGKALHGIYTLSMDASGKLYAANPERDPSIKHSSFTRGGPLAYPGHGYFDQGRTEGVDLLSGHYLPGPWWLRQIDAEFRKRGLDTSKIRFLVYKNGIFGPMEIFADEGIFLSDAVKISSDPKEDLFDLHRNLAQALPDPELRYRVARRLFLEEKMVSAGPVMKEVLDDIAESLRNHQRIHLLKPTNIEAFRAYLEKARSFPEIDAWLKESTD